MHEVGRAERVAAWTWHARYWRLVQVHEVGGVPTPSFWANPHLLCQKMEVGTDARGWRSRAALPHRDAYSNFASNVWNIARCVASAFCFSVFGRNEHRSPFLAIFLRSL